MNIHTFFKAIQHEAVDQPRCFRYLQSLRNMNTYLHSIPFLDNTMILVDVIHRGERWKYKHIANILMPWCYKLLVHQYTFLTFFAGLSHALKGVSVSKIFIHTTSKTLYFPNQNSAIWEKLREHLFARDAIFFLLSVGQLDMSSHRPSFSRMFYPGVMLTRYSNHSCPLNSIYEYVYTLLLVLLFFTLVSWESKWLY